MIFSKQEYQIKDSNRQFLEIIPPVSILLGGIIFIAGTVFAIIQYQSPDGGFKIFEQFFSELGIRQDYVETLDNGMTEQRYAPVNPEIFNITLFASGFLMIPFFMFSYRQFRNHNRFSNTMLSLAIAGGILAGIMLIGVGIFDLSYDYDTFWQQHGFWVVNLYILITVVSTAWLIMLFTARHLPYRRTKWIIIDLVLLILLVFFAVLNVLDGIEILRVQDIPFLNSYPVEAYQKMIAYLFFGYYGLVIGTRLTKTKYDNTPIRSSEDASTTKTVFCTNCGSKNPYRAPFCTSCGQNI